LGRWVSDARSETGAAADVVTIFTAVIGELMATGTVEVAVKEPKQIFTGLVRMFAMLTGKMTPDRATMLHSKFPISPT
jgi:hypothetical protein